MATSATDVANIALMRAGQRQRVTAVDGSDTTEAGQDLELLYPQARDSLLMRAVWRFASRNALIIDVGSMAAPDADPDTIPGWSYKYACPSDFLAAQYLFDGARPGQPAMPTIDAAELVAVAQVSMLPQMLGVAPQAAFEVVDGELFSDFGVAIPAFVSGTTYTQGQPVAYNGFYFTRTGVIVSVGPQPTPNSDGTTSTYWTAATGAPLGFYVNLVYTSQVTDVTKWPQLFLDAVTWKLALDLALSVATKPQLAQALEAKAEKALLAALAAEGNSEQPDLKPDASFVTVRW